jgi:hypothetical protein
MIQVLKDIGRFIKKPVNHENGDEIIERLTQAVALLSTSSWAIAESQKIYTQKVYDEAQKHTATSPTMAKMLIAGACKEEKYWVDLAEGYNKELHYTIEALRSALSYIKEEKKNTY